MSNLRTPWCLRAESGPDPKFAGSQSRGKKLNGTFFRLYTPFLWTVTAASSPRVIVLKILASISTINCRCAKMTSFFLGLPGVHMRAHTHIHFHQS